MTERDKKTLKLLAIIGGIAFLWWLLTRKKSVTIPAEKTDQQVKYGDPMLNFFAQHPTMFMPASHSTIEGGRIAIDIGNQGLNMLSDKYIPLFGFVGMAYSDTWH